MTPHAVEKRPPDWVLRLMNPLMRLVLRSAGGRAAPKLALLEFTGRRTGQRYRIVTGWYQVDGQPVVVTPARWRANFAGTWPLRVTTRGTVLHGHATLDTDPTSVARTIRQLLASGTSARALGMSMPADHVFDESDVATTRKAIVRFSPDA